jgi:two-component system, cell cycle response regulator
MTARILVAEDSVPVVAALRRALEGAGYAVDSLPLAAAQPPEAPAQYAAAVVHLGAAGLELVRALRDLDPYLTVVGLSLDEEEAAALPPEAVSAVDGELVGPLTAPGVVRAVRTAERLGSARRRLAELSAVAGRRVDSQQELAFLKRTLLLEVKRSKRYGFPVALALFAVDGWPEVAAELGAQRAPALLGELLACLSASVRDIDQAVPFGEDRLLVLLPHTPPAGALKVARRLVARIRDRDGMRRVTVSAGVAGHAGGGTVSFGSLVKGAAEALARARAQGGDRAEPAEPPPKRSRVSMG